MVSTSVPGMHSWGNQGYASLPGAHGLSPCYGGSLRASFLLGLGVAGMADHMRPQGYISSGGVLNVEICCLHQFTSLWFQSSTTSGFYRHLHF
jgi:hypothetical protein